MEGRKREGVEGGSGRERDGERRAWDDIDEDGGREGGKEGRTRSNARREETT